MKNHFELNDNKRREPSPIVPIGYTVIVIFIVFAIIVFAIRVLPEPKVKAASADTDTDSQDTIQTCYAWISRPDGNIVEGKCTYYRMINDTVIELVVEGRLYTSDIRYVLVCDGNLYNLSGYDQLPSAYHTGNNSIW